MIDEPRVGMRVRFIGTSGRSQINIGDTGVITRVDPGNSHKIQMDKEDDWHFVWPKDLTEIKENDMYLDEALKACRKDDSMEMSWGCHASWYSFGEMREDERSIGTSFMYGNSFTVRTRKPKEKQYCEYCGKKLG
jgi:hypothetical protein